MFGRQYDFNSYAAFLPDEEKQQEASIRLQRLKVMKTGIATAVWFAISLNISLWSRDNDNRLWAWLLIGGLRAGTVVALLSRQDSDGRGEAIAGSIATLFGMVGGGVY